MIQLIGLHCDIRMIRDESGRFIGCKVDNPDACPKKQVGVFNQYCLAKEV